MEAIIVFIFLTAKVHQCEEVAQSSPLKSLLDLFQIFPQGSPSGGTLGTSASLTRTQSEILRSYAFPCARTRGGNYFTKPELVRNVGPADVDVVAALGDYLVAGAGALANTTIDSFKDFPQVSFAMGGKGDWRRFTTLPNILKQFNPDLMGYSVGTFNNKGFNFGASDAISSDLSEQARELVAGLEAAPGIKMNTDWKLVTLSAGQTDLCHLSCKAEATDQDFVQNIKQALDILFALPNIIIQVVSPIDPSLIQSALHRPLSCQFLTRHLCPCVSSGSAKPRDQFLSDLTSYRQGLANLISSGRYEGRTNAAVMLQRGLEHLRLPRDKRLSLRLLGLPDISLLPDLSFLAPDCSHPSQKLHAKMAKIIWNGLFGSNSTTKSSDESLQCPSSEDPYFVFSNLVE